MQSRQALLQKGRNDPSPINSVIFEDDNFKFSLPAQEEFLGKIEMKDCLGISHEFIAIFIC